MVTKPRLPPLPLTREDTDILLSIGHLVRPSKKHFGDVLDVINESSDRRDADLMLQAQRYRLTNCVGRPVPYLLFPGPTMAIVRQGTWNASWWPDGWPDFDITYFA